MSPALRCQTTWTEDRATQRCDPSAAPGAETGAEARCDLRLAPISPPLRDRHQSDKPSWQDATIFFPGCVSPLANAPWPKFQFTVNQYTEAVGLRSARIGKVLGAASRGNRYESARVLNPLRLDACNSPQPEPRDDESVRLNSLQDENRANAGTPSASDSFRTLRQQ
jgi:hypothetical protein